MDALKEIFNWLWSSQSLYVEEKYLLYLFSEPFFRVETTEPDLNVVVK